MWCQISEAIGNWYQKSVDPEEFAAQLAKVIRWNIQERRLQEGTIKGRIKKENRKKLKKYSREVVGNKMAEIYFNVCREE